MKQFLFTLFILLVGVGYSYSQRTLSGTVTDEAGVPLIGANVVAKESSEVGTITDIDGTYKLQIPANVTAVVFSYTGYETIEVPIGATNELNVTMSEGKLLEEVVVTALGIKRDKSNLGYSVGQITSNELVTGRTTNVTNALVGKVAGIRVSGSGGSFTGSGIIVRGFTTFLGSNQPLYVVDGIPIDNSGGGTPLQTGSSLSNRAIDLNQEDIENISVLKGAGATTLYGSRGASGVILITTKKGNKNQKNSITYTANYATQEVNRFPDYQNEYGQGAGGLFNPAAISSWGPRIDGRKVTLPPDYRAAGIGDSVALTAYPKNVEELFRKGFNMQHNLSFQGGNEKSTYRLSLGYLQDQGVFDNNRLNRYNVGLNASQDITSKLNAAVSINYSTNGSKRTLQGNQLSNPLFRSWFTPRSWDLTGLPYQTATGSQLHYDPVVDNPRWTIYNNLNDDNTDRILGNVNLTYKMNSWLTANYKIGVDNFTFTTKSYDQIGIRGGGSTNNGPTGAIRETSDIVRNINSYLSLSASKSLNDDFEIMGVLGHEVIDEKRDAYGITGRGLIVPGLRNLSTNTTSFTPGYAISKRRIVGVFGNVTTIYKNFATVDVSLRNDWNSTLPTTANSYLYYSAAGTINLTEALPSLKSNTVNLLKLRGNYGRTGKGGDFLYATDTYFATANPADGFGPQLVFPFNSLGGFTYSNAAGNPNLRPEFTNSIEFGIDLGLFDNRIVLDLTKYNQKTTDVIFAVPNSSAAGISSAVSNSGELSTDGWEVALTLVPVKSKSVTWSSTFNLTKYVSTVDKLAPGVQNIFLGGFTTPNIRLVEGDQFGQIYGTDYLKDAQGRLILTATGLPRPTANVSKIGNPNPNYTLGISNSITVKNFNLNVLLDIRDGGDIYSRNIADLQRNGVTVETAEKDRLNSDGTAAKNYIFEGVLPNGTENKDSDPNAVRVTAEQYYGNSGIFVAAKGFIYGTSWFRVREVSFSYSFPKTWLDKTMFGNLELGVFGRNLFLSAPDYPHLDPEQNALGISNAQGLEFNALPQTRSYGANLRLTF